MSSRPLSVPLSVPVPGGHALRRARRILHEGAATRGDIAYRVYVVVLLAAMFVVPAISGVTSTVPADRVSGLVWAMREWCALVLVAACLAPTHFGPVITYEGELHFLVAGPFGASRVLRGRTWTVLAAALLATGALAVTVGVGLGLSSWALLATGTWIVGACALVFLGLLGIQSAANRWARLLTAGVGVALVVLARHAGRSGWTLGGDADLRTAAVLAGCVILSLAVVPVALGHVPLRVMEHDIRMRRLIRSGLGVGDVKALTTRDGPRRRWGRRRSLDLGGSPLRRSMAVSALDLLRTPVRSGFALAVLALCGAWVAAVAEGVGLRVARADAGSSDLVVPFLVFAPVALVASQWAFGVLAGALVDVLETLGARRLDPMPLHAQVRDLLAVPVALVVVSGGVGAAGCAAALALFPGLHALAAGSPGSVVVVAAVVLVVLVGPLLAVALSASGAAPLMAFTSSPSPLGDTSSLWVVAWMLRGLAPAALLTLVVVTVLRHGQGVGGATAGTVVVLLLVSAGWAGVHLRHLGADDRRAQGLAPAQG